MDKIDRRKALDTAKSQLQAAEAEVVATRRRVQELEETIKREDGITKRDVVQGVWVTPVVMAVNLPKSVFAAGAVSPVAATPAPSAPTPSPGTPAPSAPTPSL